jgi:hypothetical protein
LCLSVASWVVWTYPGHDPYMSGDLGVFGASKNSDLLNP